MVQFFSFWCNLSFLMAPGQQNHADSPGATDISVLLWKQLFFPFSLQKNKNLGKSGLTHIRNEKKILER